MKTRGREEKGERVLFNCLNHHRQSEFAGGRIICTSFVSSLGILMLQSQQYATVMNRSTTFQYCLRSS